MTKFDIDKAIALLNQRLKASSVAASVERRGGKLMIRSTLPRKPKDGIGMKQYPVTTGISANREGLKLIEAKAHELRRQVDNGTFTWANWERSRTPKPDELPASQWVVEFKKHYFQKQKGKIKESTWVEQWQRTFNRLPQDEPLTDAAILAVVLTTEDGTDTRKRTCQRLQALADYAGVEIDLSHYAGDYGRKSVKPRDLPSDTVIAEWRDRIPDQNWQWVYGMIATFGLRPHEVFAVEFIDRYTVQVLDEVETRTGTDETKTGYHVARAFPPEWAEQWNLIEVHRPKVTARKTSDYGDRNKRQFQRYEIPFPAYNLRHRYALRGGLDYGMNTAQMAKMMGHDEATHIKTYRRWLSEAELQTEYDRLVLRKPPESP